MSNEMTRAHNKAFGIQAKPTRRAPLPDCRTCSRYRLLGGPWCDIHDQCTNGDRYQALPPVKLWRTNATSTSP